MGPVFSSFIQRTVMPFLLFTIMRCQVSPVLLSTMTIAAVGLGGPIYLEAGRRGVDVPGASLGELRVQPLGPGGCHRQGEHAGQRGQSETIYA